VSGGTVYPEGSDATVEGGAFIVAPDGTWVLRGGYFSVGSRERNLRKVHDTYGVWGICVAAKPDCDPDEISAYQTFGNETMLIALSEEIATVPNVQVVIEPGRDWPNALLKFAAQPTLNDWQAVIEVFKRRPARQNQFYKGSK
jgi:hypothetical protein